MSKEIEKLKEEVRAALQGFSEPEIFLLIGIGIRVDSPSQAVRRVSPIVHLSPKEEEVVRKIAKLKKMVRDVDPRADFSKVLQDLRKPKESKMDKKEIIQRIKNLEKEVQGLKVRTEVKVEPDTSEKDLTLKERVNRLKKLMGSETEVAKFIKRVVEIFESDDYFLKHVEKEQTTTFCQVDLKLNKKELTRVERELKEIGFEVDRPKRGDGYIDLNVTLRKKKPR